MTDLRRTLISSGTDHQITREESQQLVKAAKGSEAKLSRAIEAQGFRHWQAEHMADQIIAQAAAPASTAPASIAFPAPAPYKADRLVHFVKNQAARLDLLRSAPQQEPSPPSLMPVMSGGAVIAAAMVLDSQSLTAAKQNVKAMISLARELGENPDIDKESLDRMATGKMTPRDVQRLQNMLLAMTSRIPVTRQQPGVTADQLNTLVARLREHGALQNTQSITFQSQTVSHQGHRNMATKGEQWSVTVDGVHVQPWANDGHDRSAIVTTAR